MKHSLKKMLGISLAAAMVFSATACSGSSESSTTAAASETTENAGKGGETAGETEAEAAEPSGETITLRLGHTQSTEHLINTSAQSFADMVEEKTGGAIHIDIFPQETLGTILPDLAQGKISPEEFTRKEDESIQEFLEEQ